MPLHDLLSACPCPAETGLTLRCCLSTACLPAVGFQRDLSPAVADPPEGLTPLPLRVEFENDLFDSFVIGRNGELLKLIDHILRRPKQDALVRFTEHRRVVI